MSLGENIYRLRTGKNMSQEDLGAALGVSRQSISKWETDGATPELDKLVKLAGLFGVTLDELVTGKRLEDPKPEPEKAAVERQGVTVPRAVGIVLLCMAFAVAVLFTAVGRLLEGVVYAVPFLICGLICSQAKKHPGLWCAWALFLVADCLLRCGTGLSWAQVRFTFLWKESWNYTRLAIAWCQLLCGLGLLVGTVVRLRRGRVEWTRRNKVRLGAGCLLLLLLRLPWSFWAFLSLNDLAILVGWLQDSLSLALLAALGTMLARGRKG